MSVFPNISTIVYIKSLTSFFDTYVYNLKKTGNIPRNITLWLVRVTIVLPCKSNKYYVCCVYSLSYPACEAHAPYYIVICGLSGSTIFSPHYLINGTTFGKKLNIKCVFWFSLQRLSQICLILRRIQRDILINVHRSSSKVPVIPVRF